MYGAYLKKFKTSALKDIDFKILELDDSVISFKIYNDYAENVIKDIKGDIVYIDPPYNNRQYASNYHILEMISNDFDVEVFGKTALPKNRKMSDFSSKRKVNEAFEYLIKNCKFNNMFISYNTDGIMTQLEIENTLKKYYLKTNIKKINYPRFKADTSIDRVYDETDLEECLSNP